MNRIEGRLLAGTDLVGVFCICVGYATVWSGIYECNEYIPLQTVA